MGIDYDKVALDGSLLFTGAPEGETPWETIEPMMAELIINGLYTSVFNMRFNELCGACTREEAIRLFNEVKSFIFEAVYEKSDEEFIEDMPEVLRLAFESACESVKNTNEKLKATKLKVVEGNEK